MLSGHEFTAARRAGGVRSGEESPRLDTSLRERTIPSLDADQSAKPKQCK